MGMMVNMMLTDSNIADMEYVDLPRESTRISWEQHNITFVSNMVDENQQDTIMEGIVHQDEDFVPGATTREAFANMVKCGNPDGSTQQVKIFHESQRLPRCDKLLFATSPEEAITTFLYHLTERHISTQYFDKAVMISPTTPLRKMTVMLCFTQFSRGFQIEQYQLEADNVLKLTEQERDNQRTWTIPTTGTWGTMMNYYSWENNYAWSYNHVRNIETIVNNVNVNVKKVNAFFIQPVFYYSGIGILQHMPNNTVLALLKYTQEYHIDIPSLPVKDINRLRGYPDLNKWIQENNTLEAYSNYVAEVNGHRQQEPICKLRKQNEPTRLVNKGLLTSR